MLDLILISTLGFLGSFGHCVGMCGPLTIGFFWSQNSNSEKPFPLHFHILLNLGRIISYALVGAAIGGLSSTFIASGQFAGIGSGLRRTIAIFTGLMLISFGAAQIQPKLLPSIPILHPLTQKKWHDLLSAEMHKISRQKYWWTPALLGIVWGFIPCGFLYAAQIKAAETGNWQLGSATMLAFGVGTVPSLLGVGMLASQLSVDRRGKLFQMGGWLTMLIGILTLLRTEEMIDYSGLTAILLLMLALIARPMSHLLPQLLAYRRALGVGAFILAVTHTGYMLDHTLKWNFQALSFMLPQHQWGMIAGILALTLMIPPAVTSFDRIQHYLGRWWRHLHILAVPALVLCAIHSILIGSHYLGGFEWTMVNKLLTGLLAIITLSVLLVRSRATWSILSIERFYVDGNVKQK